MLDRQKIEAILTRRFPGATRSQIAAATNAIMGLGDEWEELLEDQWDFGYQYSSDCRDICSLARDYDRGAEFRFFRRRESPGSGESLGTTTTEIQNSQSDVSLRSQRSPR